MELNEIVERVRRLIETEKRHEDYSRTVELSKEYRKFITTIGLDKELEKTKPVTETDEMFQTRKEITHFTSKSVCSNIKKVFYEVGKSDNLKKRIHFDDDKEGERKEVLESRIKDYAGSKSLEKFLGIDLVDLVFEDPNAFVNTEFENFDSDRERAKPYPVVYYSDSIRDYHYKNNVLVFFATESVIEKADEEGESHQIEQYYIFGEDVNVKIEQRIDSADLPQGDSERYNGETLVSFNTRGRTFDLTYYEHNTGFVPAFRAGYETDSLTRNRTFVGPLDPALPHFYKSIRISSELDITITKHAHPKEYSFVSKGNGRRSVADIAADINAEDGSAPKSAMEVTEIELPQGRFTDDDLPELSKLAFTKTLPVDFVKWMAEHVDAIEAKCKKAVFNSDTFERDTSVSTATEKRIERDAVNATLKPFGDLYSNSFKFSVRAISSQMDLGQDVQVTHYFNGDFKEVTIQELIEQYETLQKADAPGQIKEKVADEIKEKQFRDDPRGLRILNVKSEHDPFKGKSKEEIMFLLASQFTSDESKILYSNFDTIFSKLEMEHEGFYAKNFKERKRLIDQEVLALQSLLSVGMNHGLVIDLEEDKDVDQDVEAEARANLRGSVGGTQGILSVQESVSKGITQYSAAVALLREIYGFDESVAKSILGNPVDLKEKVEQGDLMP